jgi:hypothetical protein
VIGWGRTENELNAFAFCGSKPQCGPTNALESGHQVAHRQRRLPERRTGDIMRKTHWRRTSLLLFGLLALIANAGCKREPIGTSDNLKADYDRAVKERDDLKADFDKCEGEIQSVWQQRVSDRDQKIADLTSENANLRERLLVADAADQDIPLTDSARTRSMMWLHIIYVLIIAACLALVTVVLWVHVNLRERVRIFVMQQAKFIPTKEVLHVK